MRYDFLKKKAKEVEGGYVPKAGEKCLKVEVVHQKQIMFFKLEQDAEYIVEKTSVGHSENRKMIWEEETRFALKVIGILPDGVLIETNRPMSLIQNRTINLSSHQTLFAVPDDSDLILAFPATDISWTYEISIYQKKEPKMVMLNFEIDKDTKLNIDIDKAAEKIAKEKHISINSAYTDANALKNYHPALFPIIETWLSGEECEFEFQGISPSYIMKKERCCYFSTLSRMSVLLKNPDSIEHYKNRVFRIR